MDGWMDGSPGGRGNRAPYGANNLLDGFNNLVGGFDNLPQIDLKFLPSKADETVGLLYQTFFWPATDIQ